LTSPILLSDRTKLPEKGQQLSWGRLIGASTALAAAELAARLSGENRRPLLILAEDPKHADQLEAEIRFFAGATLPIDHFVEWETLPWDNFSPHQDIVSQRLSILADLGSMQHGVIIATVGALQQRLPPLDYVAASSIALRCGQILPRADFTRQLTESGYLRVPQVTEHGEFAIRGSLIDLFPMGADTPIRVDFFDDEIESLRFFSTATQRSSESLDGIRILPAREIPLDAAAISSFRHNYRERFDGQPGKSRVYQDVSEGIAHGGIEYYLPLFFANSASLLDYLPDRCVVLQPAATPSLLEQFWNSALERFEMCSLDPERPILSAEETFFDAATVTAQLATFGRIRYCAQKVADAIVNYDTGLPPAMKIETRYEDAAAALMQFLQKFDGRVLFSTDSPGRREQLAELLAGRGLDLARMEGWHDFLSHSCRIGVTVAPIDDGVVLPGAKTAVVSEQQLFGARISARRRKRRVDRDPETIIRQLSDLEAGSPIVHAENGVGRYLGLVTLEAGGIVAEFLHLEYADGDKLYVPVHALELISRYTGASPDNAPLHRLGSDQWDKARKRATRKIRDVAAELLDIYARRAARSGHPFHWPESEYRAFEAGFGFELTQDQAQTIDEVLQDLTSARPMDRVVCGDVGFGKTEVALRATFAVIHGGKQVAVLVPTTLLAQQHGQTFRDRFADWPVRVEVLSRFQTATEVREIVKGLQSGTVDVVIGTHRLLQHSRDFRDIGLIIIDEEHRFGVRHKESIKSLRSEIDILTLTATPIPRTLNMALGGIREMSLITTPPADRLAVKTFVLEWNDVVIREACLREIKRGGQVYFIHNRVEDIGRIEAKLQQLVPEANIRIGHGQLPERELEQVMLDFYHRRFNILLCTTIVESGIDVPTANTIIINRADRFGLAQLHQLRGRVGRSHHRAYAYMIAPPKAVMTADAAKRLEAIDSLEELGSGFILATHDLEIRGAGELLGDTQSGQIQEIGFALYTELLGRAVESLKAGKEPDLNAPFNVGVDINFHVPALLPEDYVPDVHLRLITYKRISATQSVDELRELQVELIDRFGLLPPATRNLLRMAAIKRLAAHVGVEKIDASDNGGYLIFGPDSRIDPVALVQLVQNDAQRFRLQGPHRLRVVDDLQDLEHRFTTFEKLLQRLTGRGSA
jgi:transcription-repair coupling factor (superfamily II helicase)